MPRFLADYAAADKRDLPNCGKKPCSRWHFRSWRDWARHWNWP